MLCVDDDEEALSVRRFMLETRGYRVIDASSADEAIELFPRQHIDALVIELGLPRMDGNVLIGLLKAMRPETPALLHSSSVRSGERLHRADWFLGVSDFSPPALLEKLKIMCACKRGPKKVRVITQEMVG